MKRMAVLAAYQKKLLDEGLVLQPIADEGVLNKPVRHITYDSRCVEPGTLFVCKGEAFREAYLEEALASGAVAWVSECRHESGAGIVVSDVRKAMAVLANELYGEPWRDFPLIGLAGTKGKTTTLYFLRNIIEDALSREGSVGYLSSVETYDGRQRFESHLTTPEALVLAGHFDSVRDTGLWGMVMEVSSQALKYDRTLGVAFDIGCFLNFGADHIGGSEHTDEEDYFSSKLKFFDQCRTVCLNADTEGFDRILDAIKRSPLCERLVLFSPEGRPERNGVPVAYTAGDVRISGGEIRFHIYRNESGSPGAVDCGEFALAIRGLFNVENALAAAVVSFELGLHADCIRKGMLRTRVAGRMEVFENPEKKLVVIVDYAHNRMSFESLYASTKEEYPGWRIEAIFGCPGGKGLQRREELPEIVARYADFAWITEEDAGEEDVRDISEQLIRNLGRGGCPSAMLLDREEAIRTAIESAPPETVIVLTGKGRENYQKRGTDYVPVISDVDLVRRYL